MRGREGGTTDGRRLALTGEEVDVGPDREVTE